ncbi:MAG: conjugal transfer protein [Actinomycetota bacterium]
MNDWVRARFLSTAVAVLVLAGAICGPVALYLTLTDEDATGVGPTIDLPDERAAVAGQFASLFVAGWLRGDDLGFFNPTLAANESGLLVERVATVRTTERGQGLFDVVVAADLVEFIEGSEEQFRPVGLRFYAVGVSADDDSNLLALGAPALVEAPDTAAPATPVIAELSPPTTPELAGLTRTLDGFFAAYLVGEGEVGLFTSPDSVIGAVTPAPFARVRVRQLGRGAVPGVDDDGLQLARVQLDAQSPSGSQLLEYSLVLAERDGRWEVSQVLHAPIVITRGDAE